MVAPLSVDHLLGHRDGGRRRRGLLLRTAPRPRKRRRPAIAAAHENAEWIAIMISLLLTRWLIARSMTRTPAGPAENGGLCESDEQAVLDHARNGREPVGQRLRIGDPPERCVQYPVTTVRDESVAILVEPQLRRPGTMTAPRQQPRPPGASPRGRTAPPRSAAESGRAPAPTCSRRQSPPCVPRRRPRSFRATARRRRP